MVYTVTFNPSLDHNVWMKNFELGKTNRTQKETMAPGGKGLNVSHMLHNMGMESVAIGFTAGFVGDEIEKEVATYGINSRFIHAEGCSRINVKLQNFEGTEINGSGLTVTKENLEELKSILSELKAGDCLVLGGSLPKSLPDTIYRDIICEINKSCDEGVRIIVDTTGQQLMDVLPYHPFLVKPNVDELGDLFGREIYFRDDIEKYARLLIEKGAENVMVSMGSLGAILIDEYGKLHELSAPKGQLVSAVGSGDAMVGGFIYGYLNYHDYETAFRYSVAAGSASAFTDGFADKEVVEELYQKFWDRPGQETL